MLTDWRPRWPSSLAGRVAAILALVLGGVHGLTLLWLQGGRAELGRSLMVEYLGPDVAQSVALLDQLAPAQRAAWLPRLARPNYRYALAAPGAAAAPAVAPDDSATGRRIGATLTAVLGADRVRGVWQAPAGGPDSADTRLVQLQLADGTPLTLALWPVHTGAPATALVVLGLQLLLLAGAALLCMRLATRPLTQLASAAASLDPDRPGPALPEAGPAEVVQAARAFNAMQQRVQAALAERTQILAAVAHDLQTPITRLRLRAELLDDGALRERLQADLAQMQALVAQGLAYARSAHAAQEPAIALDLAALLQGLVADYDDPDLQAGRGAGQAVADPAGHGAGRADADPMGRVTLHALPALAPCCTRPHTLRRLLGNLVDNALKFAGAAELGCTMDAAQVHLTVADRGPGIPADQLQWVRQPFQRLEGSRNRSTGGSGLGLAIADQLAQALDGTLVLRPRNGGGLEAVLSLPRR